jgi:hypothetical protein
MSTRSGSLSSVAITKMPTVRPVRPSPAKLRHTLRHTQNINLGKCLEKMVSAVGIEPTTY